MSNLERREKVIWAAGFFDGEGSIGIYRRGDTGGFRLDITVGNTDRATLEVFEELWGGSIWTEHRQPPKKIFHFWRLCRKGTKATPFLEEITPHLRSKHAQAEIALRYAGRKRRPVADREADAADAVAIRALKAA